MDEMMVKSENTSLVGGGASNFFSSFNAQDMESKKKLYNALNSPDFKIADCINREIKMKDAVVTNVTMVDDKTGEVKDAVRSVIIDMDGKTYNATSSGIHGSLNNIMNIFGTLHFDDGLTVIVQQVQTKRGSTLTLTLK